MYARCQTHANKYFVKKPKFPICKPAGTNNNATYSLSHATFVSVEEALEYKIDAILNRITSVAISPLNA